MCTSNLKVISLQMGLPVVCKSNYHTITANDIMSSISNGNLVSN
jgi:hypothetical protein